LARAAWPVVARGPVGPAGALVAVVLDLDDTLVDARGGPRAPVVALACAAWARGFALVCLTARVATRGGRRATRALLDAMLVDGAGRPLPVLLLMQPRSAEPTAAAWKHAAGALLVEAGVHVALAVGDRTADALPGVAEHGLVVPNGQSRRD